MSRAAYMREYRARRKAYGLHPPTLSYVDYPVVDGAVTLPDGRTITSTSKVIRVAYPNNLPKPEPYVEPDQRIAELEAEVAHLKRELAQRPARNPFAEFRPAPKHRPKQVHRLQK